MNLRGNGIRRAQIREVRTRISATRVPDDTPATSPLSRVLSTVETLELDACIGRPKAPLHVCANSIALRLAQPTTSRLSMCNSVMRRYRHCCTKARGADTSFETASQRVGEYLVAHSSDLTDQEASC